jgi:hypothetical protein
MAMTACTQTDNKPTPERDSSGRGAALPGSSAAPDSSVGTPDSRTAQAVAAYRAMWADAVAVGVKSDETDPRLDDHARNGGLGLLRYAMRQNAKQGIVAKGQVHLAPVAKRVGRSKVTIEDCLDSTHWLQYRTDGTLKNNVPGGHHKVDATVVESGGRWLVDSLYVHEVGTCGA